tara:strand:- start:1031 stop:1243 length:213 start_codon:yes stop_codon:yes gene_type:complete
VNQADGVILKVIQKIVHIVHLGDSTNFQAKYTQMNVCHVQVVNIKMLKVVLVVTFVLLDDGELILLILLN